MAPFNKLKGKKSKEFLISVGERNLKKRKDDHHKEVAKESLKKIEACLTGIEPRPLRYRYKLQIFVSQLHKLRSSSCSLIIISERNLITTTVSFTGFNSYQSLKSLFSNSPTTCFSKVPVTFRARKAVLYLLCLHSRSKF